ncbi:MAG: two-component system response regulator [Moraxellaceae bacterium]|nr:MAG: two-component system response regulator [Moraxellaceae bacterium]
MSKTVFITDDDEVFADILMKSFNKRGYQAYAANNIEQTLALLDSYTPDYAVIDLKIDQESGLQLLTTLVKRVPGVVALILTGYSSISTAVEAVKLGATDYLCKPVNTDEIICALEEQKTNPGIPIATSPPSVSRLEWEHIQRVLSTHNGNISATAKALGMHRRTLQRKLQKRPVSR